MKNKNQKLLSILLALVMLTGLLPATAIAAPGEYEVWVGGTQITADNKDDVLADGGSVSYDPDTSTLTLNNANITGAEGHGGLAGNNLGIEAHDSLNLVLVGENTVTAQEAEELYSGGVWASVDLTISGEGSLTATGAQGTKGSWGLAVAGRLNIRSGSVTAAGGEALGFSVGIMVSTEGSLTVDGGTVAAIGGTSGTEQSYGILSEATTVINGGTLTAVGNVRGFMGEVDLSGYSDPAVTVNTEATETGAVVWNGTDDLGGEDSTFKFVKVDSATVPPVPSVMESIAITTPPAKTEYTEGETFDPAGMVVTVTYDDNSEAVVTEYTISPDGPLSTDDTEVTVSYTENDVTKTATQAITVNPAPVVTYTVSFNANGGEGAMTDVVVNSGDSFTLPANEFTAPADKQFAGWAKDSAEGTQYQPGADVTVDADTVFYALWEDVPAGVKTPASIAVTTPPAKTEYTEGETFDPVGMVITATYEDGTIAEVKGFAVSPSGPLTPANTSVTVSYTEGGVTRTVTQNITVNPAVTYTVTFDANGGSVTPASAVTGADGKLASLPTATRSGSYSFDGWYTRAVDGTLITTDTVFTADTTVYAHWASTGGGSGGGGGGGGSVKRYTLTFDVNGGSDIPSVTRASGAVIKLASYRPTRNGYDFEGWYSDAALKNRVTEVRLTKNTTVYAKWTEKQSAPINPFIDVDSGEYYYDAVMWAVRSGVTSGTSANTFTPDGICTRAQMITFLWRYAGSPMVTGSMPFTDVPGDTYYYDAVLWAHRNGVTLGTSDTTFSPDMTVTRAQVVTLLYRFKGAPVQSDSVPFIDVTADAWYYDAVRWAVRNEITNGTTAVTFSPDNGCTRAQIVTFLYRAEK